MLKKIDFDDDLPEVEDDRGYLLSPKFYWALFKRRWMLLVFPVVIIGAVGVAAAVLWPATYLSEGKILVQSQQIPTELVRPTVTSAAQERIQVIEQRTMTRDNLVAIADKFQLFPDKRTLMSVTELVELMKKRTKIAPVDLDLDFKQRRPTENPTIVFSVGFEYSDPATATQVANELMTRILNEDLRDRTSRATDTTKFLAREVQKLRAENAILDAKIAQLKLTQGTPATPAADQPATMLSQLKAELLQKSALYSDRHPAIQALKRQIRSLEDGASANATKTEVADSASFEALTVQQETLQKNLEAASTKLAAAQLGENLEKDQQSEKLEIIEQPTIPQQPVRPNRPKVAGVSILLAFAAAAGLTLAVEMLDQAIRRPGDVAALVSGQLVVSIPYIITSKELRRRRWLMRVAVIGAVAFLIAALVAAYLLLPIDLILAKARVGLFR